MAGVAVVMSWWWVGSEGEGVDAFLRSNVDHHRQRWWRDGLAELVGDTGSQDAANEVGTIDLLCISAAPEGGEQTCVDAQRQEFLKGAVFPIRGAIRHRSGAVNVSESDTRNPRVTLQLDVFDSCHRVVW